MDRQQLDAVFAASLPTESPPPDLAPSSLPPEEPELIPPRSDGDEHDSLVAKGLRRLTRFTSGNPFLVMLLIVCACTACGIYTSKHLHFKTKRADLIDPQADYHRRWLAFTRDFGDVPDMVVAVEGENPDHIKPVLDEIGQRLEKEPQYFADVLYRVDTSNLRHKGLQYLPPEQLEPLLNRLEEFSPVLRGKWDLLNPGRIYQGLRFQMEALLKQPDTQIDMNHQLGMAEQLSASLAQFARDPRKYQSPWGNLLPLKASDLRVGQEVHYQLNTAGNLGVVLVKPVGADEGFEGAKRSVERLRALIRELQSKYANVTIGLTGIPVLEYDEMQSSEWAMLVESIASYSGVGILLVLGFRGMRFPIMALMMLAVATSWSFGFTTATVGHLNILSVSFVAIVVGLGIDYAILFLSRYLRLRQSGRDLHAALEETSGSIGPGIVTAAATTSLAFFCAVFTDFLGVAELGLIAGGGIILCAFTAFTFLPAVISIVDRFFTPSRVPSPFEGRTIREITWQHPGVVIVVALALIGLVGGYGFRMKYDYNLMNLQADGVDSVEVQKRIAQRSENRILFAVSLADTPAAARELKKKFEALPTVHHVEEIASALPNHAPEDYELLVQGIDVFLQKIPQELPPPTPANPISSERSLLQFLEFLPKIPGEAANHTAENLTLVVRHLEQLPLEEQVAWLTEYQQRITADLIMRLRGLAAVADPEPVNVKDLPTALTNRFVSKQGKWLLQIYPKAEIWDLEPLHAFIQDIRTIDPEVTGVPLQNYEASRQIRQSYETVALYALLASYFVLLIDFLDWRHALMGLLTPLGAVVAMSGVLVSMGRALDPMTLAGAYVLMTLTLVAVLDVQGFINVFLSLLPPFAGAALTLGTLGLLHVDFNPANLIILPLILGIGVDNGVHVMHDFRLQKIGEYRTSPSLINALFLTSMSNMAGFASMILAAHRGLRSIGMVLTIGVGSCLFVSVVLLPAILTLWSRVIASMSSPHMEQQPPSKHSNPSPENNPSTHDSNLQDPPELSIFYPSDYAA